MKFKEFTSKYAIVLIIASFAAGFLAWYEYMGYKIKSAVSEAFSWFSDDSISEQVVTKDTENKKIPSIEFGQKNKYENWLNVYVGDIISHGSQYKDDIWDWMYIAHDWQNINSVRIYAENNGNNPQSLDISSATLIGSDGKEYNSMTYSDISLPPEGYEGCVTCWINPWYKAVSDILFDVPDNVIKGWDLILWEAYNNSQIKYKLKD